MDGIVRRATTLRLGAALALGLAVALALGPAAALALGVLVTAEPDAYQGSEDTPLVVSAPGVLLNDLGDGLCVVGYDYEGLSGTVTDWGTDGSFTFEPWSDWAGETSFTYGIRVGDGQCIGAAEGGSTVTVTVLPVNDAPTAGLGPTCAGNVTVAEDSGAFVDDARCTEVHSWGASLDENLQGLAEWLVSNDNPGLFSAQPALAIAQDTFGRLSFTPAANAHGSATVTVRARDDGGTDRGGVDLSAPVSFTITVSPVNDPPSASADAFFVLVDRTLNVSAPGLLKNDSDVEGDGLTASKVSNPAHGVVTVAADGGFSYTPAAGYLGLDAFSYRVSDGSGSSQARIVTLNVTALPPPPTPTPAPTTGPSVPPTPSATAGEASPSGSAGASPSASAAASTASSAGPSAAPAESPDPDPAAGGGGVSMPILLTLVVLVVLLAFGAAVYVPKWLQSQRTGEPLDLE